MNAEAFFESCPVCGGMLSPVSEIREVRLGSRSTRALDQFFRCQECGEELYAPGQFSATQCRASDLIRQEEGLLLPAEIRQIRENLGLTQRAFEELLGVGPKTVVRWERGTVFQNKSTDSLLRIVREVTGAAEYLAAQNGVELAAPSIEVVRRKSTTVEREEPLWTPGDTYVEVRGTSGQREYEENFGGGRMPNAIIPVAKA